MRNKSGEGVGLWFHFSRGQNQKSPSTIIFCSETKLKRLLRRLTLTTLKETLPFSILSMVHYKQLTPSIADTVGASSQCPYWRESVIAGVYFSQSSVICFCRGFSYCPFYRGFLFSGVSAMREWAVPIYPLFFFPSLFVVFLYFIFFLSLLAGMTKLKPYERLTFSERENTKSCVLIG